ncbi:hypothetical protein MLT81_24140 [Escherichia coli]|nr:hypothetical protein [Escherichia coli]
MTTSRSDRADCDNGPAPSCTGHHRRDEDERIFQNTSGAAGRLLYPRTGGSRCRTVPERLYRG